MSVSTLCLLLFQQFLFAQDKAAAPIYRNQISTNVLLPLFGSFDLSYERTIANKWALGFSGAIYSNGFGEYGNYENRHTKYELMPFARLYMGGAQKRSHFLELFGSLSRVEARDAFVRTLTEAGYGVYNPGSKTYTLGGLGFGYGYRFLFLDNKLVVEAELGIRTNFEVNYFYLNAALVRTGLRVGYRF